MTDLNLSDGEQKIFFRAGDQWCYLWTPETFKKILPTPIVIHHHGAGGFVKDGSADWLDEEPKASYLKAIMQSTGCAVAGSHACGDHWGNADAVAANAALFDALKDMVNVSQDRIGLMGGGLGGALVWNSVLGPLAGSVKCVVVMQAASSLEGVIRERKFRSPLLAAYSLPEDTSDEEAIAQVAPHDPLPRFQKLARGARLPRTAIYHGAKDENLPPHIHATPLAEALKKAGGEVKLELFLGVGHAVYAMGKDIETHLKSFFSSSLGVGTGQHLKTEQSRRRA